MPPDLPTQLARKWCAYCAGEGDHSPDAHHYHGAVAAAVREALEGAEARLEELNSEGEHDKAYHEGYSQAVHDAIAALRKGR